VLQANRNLFGGPIRERDGADALGRHVQRVDQMVDPGDQAERLPGPGSRDHEHRAERCLNGEALRGEGVELHAGV